ncbi:MAG: hypothetical protein ABI811_21790 [Acidobacteriota bacterium]
MVRSQERWFAGSVVMAGAVAALTAGLLTPIPGQAQQAKAAAYKVPRTKDGKPNLNGVWMSNGMANWDLEPHGSGPSVDPKLGSIYAVPPSVGFVVGGQIPYKPAALEQKKKNFAARAKDDPEAKCYMGGVPRANYMSYPFQIIQGGKDIMFTYEYAGAVRVINMGAPAKAPADSWMGTNNGHWEGETLVVDVTSLGDQSWLDRAGNYHSDQLHVVERYTPRSADVLMYEARIEDPEIFTQPWTIRVPLYRQVEDGARILEFKCVEFAEELLYGHLRKPPGAPAAPPAPVDNGKQGKQGKQGKGKAKQ